MAVMMIMNWSGVTTDAPGSCYGGWLLRST